MKLWVDDLRDAPDDSWTVARKVEPATNIICNMKLEEISLDHDIENRPDDETFCPLAFVIGLRYQTVQEMSDFITGFGPRVQAVPKITIHSINPVGAKRMQAILSSYSIKSTYIPYKLAEFNKKYGLEGEQSKP